MLNSIFFLQPCTVSPIAVTTTVLGILSTPATPTPSETVTIPPERTILDVSVLSASPTVTAHETSIPSASTTPTAPMTTLNLSALATAAAAGRESIQSAISPTVTAYTTTPTPSVPSTPPAHVILSTQSFSGVTTASEMTSTLSAFAATNYRTSLIEVVATSTAPGIIITLSIPSPTTVPGTMLTPSGITAPGSTSAQSAPATTSSKATSILSYSTSPMAPLTTPIFNSQLSTTAPTTVPTASDVTARFSAGGQLYFLLNYTSITL